MILEANDDTELFDLAHQRMGLSQRVFSVLLAFQFSSLPSPRVSGQNYDSIVLHLKEQNYLHLHTATIDQGKHAILHTQHSDTPRRLRYRPPLPNTTICVAKKDERREFVSTQAKCVITADYQVGQVAGDFSGCFTT